MEGLRRHALRRYRPACCAAEGGGFVVGKTTIYDASGRNAPARRTAIAPEASGICRLYLGYEGCYTATAASATFVGVTPAIRC